MNSYAALPRLLTPKMVAEQLGVSVETVHRERKRRRLGFVKVGGQIRHTDDQLHAYLRSGREDPCAGTFGTASEKSEATGSVSGPAAQHGTAPGSMPQLDRLAAHRSAQMILTKPNSRSRPG